ncbi:alpha/beta hydrolase [Urechidicola croceus]|uniref:Serine aminopeptidase S33 domain-containing protein n=1 Tax=Urechidicola croceus TaxID=1850246 RepID=A0A1D8P8W1_9FLAO|nr:alpha/beta hydrolase [Urechidicola croceus]AOW20984.1 hypothetical protein LPB138_09980 [Urechidicola croceus]
MYRKKRIKKYIPFLIVLVFLILHFYVPRFITEIKNPIIGLIRQNKKQTNAPTFDIYSTNGKFIDFISFDRTPLKAFITYSKTDSVLGTIILLHGIRSQKEHFIQMSDKLSKLGFNAIAIDSRAHGESGGVHCTFGVKEKYDLKSLIDYLNSEEKITKNIGVWGQSLGGAIGLQVMGIDNRIEFGIIESTFSEFNHISKDYLKYHTGISAKPLSNYLIKRAGKIANFDPLDAKPIKYCKTINQPILIVHGNKDMRINIQYGKDNYLNIASTSKEFLEIDKGTHLNIWRVGGEEYFNKVIQFIKQNTD